MDAAGRRAQMSRVRTPLTALVPALLVSLIAVTAAAQLGAPSTDWGAATRARQIEKSTLSPFCPGKTLYDCPSPAAAEWRADIQRWVREGASATEVRARLQARRPDFDLEGATGAGPIGALVAAFTFGALLLLGWRMRRAPRDEATASDDEATDDASDGELERALDRELARFDEA